MTPPACLEMDRRTETSSHQPATGAELSWGASGRAGRTAMRPARGFRAAARGTGTTAVSPPRVAWMWHGFPTGGLVPWGGRSGTWWHRQCYAAEHDPASWGVSFCSSTRCFLCSLRFSISFVLGIN